MTGPQRLPRAFTLRAHLFAFAAAILLPVSVLTAALLLNSAQLQREQLETRLGEVAGDLTDDIDRFVSNLITTLQTVATSPALAENDLLSFHRQASAAARSMGATAIALVEPGTMQQLVNTLLPWGAELPTTGDPLSVQKVVESGAAVVSNYFMGRVSRAAAWNVGIPIYEGERVQYVLVAGMTPAQLLPVLQRQRLDSLWATTIIDANGIILARSRDHEKWSGTLNQRQDAEDHIVARTVYQTTTLEGTPALRALQRSGVSGWIVTASLPLTAAEAPLWRNLAVWFAVTLGTGLLTLLVALRMSAALSQPISRAAHAAAALGRGEEVVPMRTNLIEANAVTSALATAARALAERQTAQRRWEERQRLLLAELSHRVKNSLAVVQALALRTLTDDRSVGEARESFVRRLRAMARAHELLVESDWQGAPLRQIIVGELALFADRVRVEGPDVLIKPTVAQTLALVSHELATNAVKYGALQLPEGRVSVQWTILPGDGGKPRLRFSWTERGVPPVQPPERRGFGSVLLERAVVAELQVKPLLAFEAEGFRYQLEVPLETLAAGPRDLEHEPWAAGEPASSTARLGERP